MLIMSIYNFVENLIYSDAKKMKCMVKDLYGVLDYCYDSEGNEVEFMN